MLKQSSFCKGERQTTDISNTLNKTQMRKELIKSTQKPVNLVSEKLTMTLRSLAHKITEEQNFGPDFQGSQYDFSDGINSIAYVKFLCTYICILMQPQIQLLLPYLVWDGKDWNSVPYQHNLYLNRSENKWGHPEAKTKHSFYMNYLVVSIRNHTFIWTTYITFFSNRYLGY